jgi:L-rhamnose mutarotase
MINNTGRVCFLMHLKPERVEDYLLAHETVWPEMLEALTACGWHIYSLFLHKEDGLVVGYLETDDFDRARVEMDRTDVNTRWQATMAGYFAEETAPDQTMRQLHEYFHLA